MFVEELIEKVRGYPILYDLKNKNYRRTDVKEKIWKDIATELNTTRESCKTKWKSLRDAFRRACKPAPSRSAAPDKKTKRKWKYFEMMLFLKSVKYKRPSVENKAMDEEMSDSNANIGDFFKNFKDENSLTLTQDLDAESNDNLTRLNDNETTKSFELFLNTATQAISCISETISKQKTATAMLFSSLALKIENANLPCEIADELEIDISATVYNKLNKNR